MVAKCSYAFSFAADVPCTDTVGSSANLLEMVSVDGDNGYASVSNSCSSGGDGCPLSISCQYTDSCSSCMTHGGCLLENNALSPASRGSLVTYSCRPSSQCMQTTECVARQCSAKAKDEKVDEDKAVITIKDGKEELSDMFESTEIAKSCGGTVTTGQGLVPMKNVDVKTETDLLLETEGENKCGRFSATLSENMDDQLGLTTNPDDANRPSEDSMDKEGSSCSLWGDPPVLDNSVMWDSVPTQKEDLDNEISSKMSDSGAPNSDEKTAVLWDKPPSLTKMEEENDVGQNETNRRGGVERTGSRRWLAVNCIGAGLQNLGNTCFVNATLQCLTYTPPLVNYLLAENNSTSCRVNGLCLMCELGRHMTQCFQSSGSVIKPHSILQKLKVIAKHMRWGRQEDAHEFLRYMVDAMNKSCINGHQVSLDNSKETIVNKIFGGYLRSQVTCLQCKAESNTYDPFLDLSLDVKNVASIIIALQKFVQPETLDIDNAYNCTKCQQKVCAQKRFTIHRLSNILTIQLKRYGVMGGKVTRHIAFPEKLDLRPYMSKLDAGSLLYQLYGVLVHDGHSTNSGHYYCYIMTSKGDWYCMNDHMVRRSSLSQVLNAEAYLLLYIRQSSSLSGSTDNLSLSNSSSDGNSPIHRGAVINDSQHLESILKDDHHVPQKERVTCRGGQLPASCKRGQLGTKMKSILTGSKLQYSKTMQHKVKRLTKAQNFVMAKSENKSAKRPSKKSAKAVVLKHPLHVRKQETVAGDGPPIENLSGIDVEESAEMNLEDKVACEILKATDKLQVAGDASKSTDRPQVVTDKSVATDKHQAVCDKSKANKKTQVLSDKLKLTEKHQIVSEKLKANQQSQVINDRLQLADKFQAVGDKIKTAERLQVVVSKLKTKDQLQVVCNNIKTTDKVQAVGDKTRSSEKHQAINVKVKAADKSLAVSDKTKAGEKLQGISDKVKTADKAKSTSTEKHQASCELLTGISVQRTQIANDRSKSGDKIVNEKAVIADGHLTTSNFSKEDERIQILSNVTKKLDRNLDVELVKVTEKNLVIGENSGLAHEKCSRVVTDDLQKLDSIQGFDDRLKSTDGNRFTRDDLKITSKIPIASDQSKGTGTIKSADNSFDGIAKVTAETTEFSFPRIVLKIKQGKVVLKESHNIDSQRESSCSRKPRIPESPTTVVEKESKPDICTAKKTQNPVALKKVCDKLSAHKKQLVRKGNSHSGQVVSVKQRPSVTGTCCKSAALGRLANKAAATRRQKNNSLKEAPTVCPTTPKSYDIYDFSAESDSENIIQKTPTRKSPKAGLFKNSMATFSNSLGAELNATTQVPGLNIPLNKTRRMFCPCSHQRETKVSPRQKQPRSPVSSLALNLNASSTEDLRFKLSKNSSTMLLPISARKKRSESACITPENCASTSIGAPNPRKRITSVNSRRNIHSSRDSVVTKLGSLQPAVESCDASALPANSTIYNMQSNNCIPCTSESDCRDLNCSDTLSRLENVVMPNYDKKQPVIPIEHQSILATSESPDVKLYGSQDSSDSALPMQQSSLDYIATKVEPGNQSHSNTAAHNQSTANNVNSFAVDSLFGKVNRKKMNGQDHRTREKRRDLSTSETVVCFESHNANSGRLSLKRKAKFNGCYDHETLCRNKEQMGPPTELGSGSSESLLPSNDNSAVVPIKLKIRKVSKDEDGANIYQVISNFHQTTSSSGRQDSLSHQDAADAGSCATHHASNAIGSPHIIATDVRSSACSSLNADKPPTNNQVRESRNIFQNLEEAVMHTREEFTRQTGLGWPKLDQIGLLQMTADHRSLSLPSQQNLPVLSGFDWTALLNHTEPDQT